MSKEYKFCISTKMTHPLSSAAAEGSEGSAVESTSALATPDDDMDSGLDLYVGVDEYVPPEEDMGPEYYSGSLATLLIMTMWRTRLRWWMVGSRSCGGGWRWGWSR